MAVLWSRAGLILLISYYSTYRFYMPVIHGFIATSRVGIEYKSNEHGPFIGSNAPMHYQVLIATAPLSYFYPYAL